MIQTSVGIHYRLLLLYTYLLIVFPSWGQVKVLNPDNYHHYIKAFNSNDTELYKQHIPNDEAWEFLSENIPVFDCPDKQLERTYYFRWWTFRKHIKKTADGYIITEFLPQVGWSGKHNSINCPAGHHFYEGRWLKNPVYLKEYAEFWLKHGGNPRSYSFWAADAMNGFLKVHTDRQLMRSLLPDLDLNFKEWEKSRMDSTGLFWQIDNLDGMEVSVSGALNKDHSGYRATINSYMFGDARAISEMARIADQDRLADYYSQRAGLLKRNILEYLWDEKDSFFKVIPRGDPAMPKAKVRELHGFTPWYFSVPEEKHSVAWRQVLMPEGFYAPYGLTTTEQRNPGYQLAYEGHECQWNGPSWPFATSITLTGMINLLNDYQQSEINSRDFLDQLLIYSRAHELTLDNGFIVPWIDENLNPYTGDWISRTRLKTWKNGTWSAEKGGKERGKDYNHSTFCDLIISGLIGIRPDHENSLVINPLISEKEWDYFCLDQVKYHNKILTILYDKTGRKYHRGSGFQILVDGVEKAKTTVPQKITIKL